ncbi:MAG: cupin domain-containing protein [Spirochaetaceae bacterium]|jgi:mannose-6-phosphate isomerase-like protein (cupin superfamily)|nr:cupin domain-containing protein [Spirochaetaceae bacterium]
MHIKRNQMTVEDKEKLRGGEGTARFTHLVPAETLGRAKLFSEIRLPPGAAIGYHRHDGETEYYVFVSGTGVVNDNGDECTVVPGDVTVTGSGCSHSLANNGNEDLVLHALIIFD